MIKTKFSKNITLTGIVVAVITFSVYYFAYFNISSVYSAAAKQIYYSVGQNINDHKTGNPTVTISSGTATFSVAQTATNMGVGDRVTYGGNKIAYISGKISQTQWTLVTKTGDTPGNINNAQVNFINHEFNSLFNAISYYNGPVGFPTGVTDANHLNTSDLVGGNYILNLPLYYDTGPDVISGDNLKGVLIYNLTTGPSNYIRIYTPYNTASEVNLSQRHSGKWDGQKYNIQFNPTIGDFSPIRTYVPYVKIDGLQINVVSNNNGNFGLEVSYTSGGWVELSNNIITGQILNFAYGIYSGFSTSSTTLKIWNNLIYDLKGSAYGSSNGININNSGGTAYIYNNTLENNPIGISNVAGTVVAKNNIVQDTDPNIFGVPNPGFHGSFDPSSDYNITDNGSVPGSHSKTGTVLFVNKAGKDFHLSSSDSTAKGAGISLASDPNLAFSTDINNQTRFVPWDIGADQVDVPVFSSVSLTSTNGVNGNPSLSISLKADATYTGPVTDSVNYTFWWNCSDSSTNIGYLRQASVCGDPTNSTYGAKYDNQTGGSSTTSLTSSSHTYLPGAYNAKVVIERGAALPVEIRLSINVINTPPSTLSVTVTEPDYCLSGSAAFVALTFSDTPSDTQSAYQAQIDNDASFSSPTVDSGKVMSNSNSYLSSQGLLQFNTTYQARVRVWDSGDLVSPWNNQSICFGPGCKGDGKSWTTPKHAYPTSQFTFSPVNPPVKSDVNFTDQSTFYDGSSNHNWSWDFGDGQSSNQQNPVYQYATKGSYNITQDVTDKDNYNCSTTQLINVRRAIPSWVEILSK